MDKTIKKSLLELVILLKLNANDYYGYDLVTEVYELLTIKEGITYPVLKQLVNEDKIISYIKEDDANIRKYYKITELGRFTCLKLVKEYKSLTTRINNLMKGFDIFD